MLSVSGWDEIMNTPHTVKRLLLSIGALGLTATLAAGCSQPELGPKDGRDLPAMDLERVQVGDPAPDFTLAAYERDDITLSDYRGKKNVVLVFYRGHW